MYVDHKTPEIRRIVDASGVSGRKSDVTVTQFKGPQRVDSYWNEGSRDAFAFVNLATYQQWRVPENHPHYDKRSLELSELPPNVCLVQGGTFRGSPSSFTIHFRPENLATLLPDQTGPELSDNAKQALCAIGVKSSYRQDEFSRYDLGVYGATNPYVMELVDAGYAKTNKAGAVMTTTEGKNARRSIA